MLSLPTEVEEHSFIPILVVVSAALTIALILPQVKGLRVPVVVGEILIGIVLGQSGFELIPVELDPWLEMLSLFGFTLLMLISGMEIDLGVLRTTRRAEHSKQAGPWRLLSVTVGMFVGTLLLSVGLSELLVLTGFLDTPFLMALVLSTTSVGLVVPMLKERGETSTHLGQVLLVAAVIADFSTMVLITVVVALYRSGVLGWDIMLVTVLFGLFAIIFAVGRRLIDRPLIVNRIALATPKSAELPMRIAMTLMLGFLVVSQLVGTEIILGAFLAGILLRALSGRAHRALAEKLEAIGFGFFIPIFFVTVGASFDLPALMEAPENLTLVPILLVIAYVVKLVPAILLRPLIGKRDAIAGGFLLSSRLSLIIAASAIGLRIGAITPAINSAIILVAIITCVVSPLLYARLRPKLSESDTALSLADFRSGRHMEMIEVPVDKLLKANGHVRDLRSTTGDYTLVAVIRGDKELVPHPHSDQPVSVSDSVLLFGSTAFVQTLSQASPVEPRATAEPKPRLHA